MYITECPAGFPIPTIVGKKRIMGIIAAVSDTTAESEVAVVDDKDIKPDDGVGKILSTLTDQDGILIPLKGVASVDGTLGVMLVEPMTTRFGVSIYVKNTVPGSVCLYVK